MTKKLSKYKKNRYGYEIVASDILSRIIRGEWKKGARIDTIDELEKSYPYSRMTIFKAVQHLTSQKYLSMRRGSGVYVKNNSIIRKIGLVFSEDLHRHSSTPISYLLLKSAEDFFDKKGIDYKIYVEKYSADPMEWLPLPELESDLSNDELNGLLTVGCNAPISLMQTELWKKHAIPHVSITAHKNLKYNIIGDEDNLLSQVFDYCANLQDKTLAIIAPGENPGMVKRIQELAETKNITIRPKWIMDDFIIEGNPELEGYDHMLQLWQQDNNPRALFVTDDIVAKGVTMAALRLNIEVPEKLLIISAANKNSGIFYPVPVVKFEFDTDEYITNAGDLLLAMIDNPHIKPQEIKIQPVLNLDDLNS